MALSIPPRIQHTQHSSFESTVSNSLFISLWPCVIKCKRHTHTPTSCSAPQLKAHTFFVHPTPHPMPPSSEPWPYWSSVLHNLLQTQPLSCPCTLVSQWLHEPLLGCQLAGRTGGVWTHMLVSNDWSYTLYIVHVIIFAPVSGKYLPYYWFQVLIFPLPLPREP